MHIKPIKTIALKKELNYFLPVLLAAKRGLNVEHRVGRWCYLQLLPQIKIGQSLKPFPILNKTVFEDTFRVAVLLGERLVEIELAFLTRLFIHLHILGYISKVPREL